MSTGHKNIKYFFSLLLLSVVVVVIWQLTYPRGRPPLGAASAAVAVTSSPSSASSGRVLNVVIPAQPRQKPPGINEVVIRSRQLQRLQLLKQQCAVYFNNSRQIVGNISVLANQLNKRDVFVLTDLRRKYMYCVVPKVACTSWKQALSWANGAPHDIRVHNSRQIYEYLDNIRFLSLDELRTALDTHFKFLFVRHPFERLVSAYRDKLLKQRDEWNYIAWLTQHIKRRFRPGCQMNVSACAEGPVTFNEFVQYLIDPRTKRPFNRHWLQFNELCQPCFIDYDFIGHFKTFDDDRKFVLRKIGIDKLVRFPVTDHRNSSNSISTSQSQRSHAATTAPRTSELVDRYFAEVSPEDVNKLRRVYRIDFDLFGYD